MRPFQPSLTFYIALTERLDLFSALLTKLYYIEQGEGMNFPSYVVKQRGESVGDDPMFLVRPWTKEIEERSLKLLARAKLIDHKPSPYTVNDFQQDAAEMIAISALIKKKTTTCLNNLQSCLVPSRIAEKFPK